MFAAYLSCLHASLCLSKQNAARAESHFRLLTVRSERHSAEQQYPLHFLRGIEAAAILVIFAMGAVCASAQSQQATHLATGGRRALRIDSRPLPLSFEPNEGQMDARARFVSRGSGYALFLTPNEAVFELTARSHSALARSGLVTLAPSPGTTQSRTAPWVLHMRLVGANPATRVEGLDKLLGKSNYFVGSDPKKWRTNIPTYGKVKYTSVYPGIDLLYYGDHQQLEHDFVVHPGGDPREITLQFEGAAKLHIDTRGDLVLASTNGTILLNHPVIYQEVSGHRRKIRGGYVLKGHAQAGFQVASYDATKPLVIDPSLTFSTYLGGSGGDQGDAVAVDSTGSAYVTGSTASTDFPTSSTALQTTRSGSVSAFVTKLDANGASIVYSTYLGGGSSASATGITVDGSGSAYVAGDTDSNDFPTTTGAFQTTLSGSSNTFLVKLDPTGSTLVYSTYLGGNEYDHAAGIAVDSAGAAYVAGFTGTGSSTFPTTPGSFQPTYTGVNWAAFVTKMNPAGSGLVYSTFLAGSFNTGAAGIALDSTGAAYVTGFNLSADFPTTPGAFKTTCNTNQNDPFVTKLNPAGSGLVYSTCLAGTTNPYPGGQGFGIAVDSNGSAYVAGSIGSPDFPTTPGAFQPAFGANYLQGGHYNAFVTKLNSTGSALTYSTYLGGGTFDGAIGIAVDSSGLAYITGGTHSSDFPTTPGAFQMSLRGPSDAFETTLNPSGSALVYSTFLGGSGNDSGAGIALDSNGSAYLTGSTQSPDFPVTQGAFQTTFNEGSDNYGRLNAAFVAKISSAPPMPTLNFSTTSLTFLDQTVGTSSVSQTLTVTNNGPGNVTIAGVSLGGSNPDDYSEGDSCAGSSLAVGQTCSVDISFSPSITGLSSATLSVSDDAANSPQVVALSGYGINPVATFSTARLTFGTVRYGQSATKTVTLQNTGVGNLLISGISVGTVFTQTNDCPASLIAGASCVITVTFTPAGNAGYNDTVIVADNTVNGVDSVAVSGNGLAPAVSVSPLSVNFGNQVVGTTSAPQIVFVTGLTSFLASISSISISGPNAADFVLTPDATHPCQGHPLITCFFYVQFAPQGLGTRTASVIITDTALDSPQTVSLSAVGVAAPAIPTSFIDTVAGGGPNNSPALSANFSNISGLEPDKVGGYYVSTSGQNRVFRVDVSGTVTVVAGTGMVFDINGQGGFSGDGGPATNAALNQPQGLARDSHGNLFIADTGNQRVRRVDANTGVISTVVGTGVEGFGGDGGPAASALLDNPKVLAVDSADNLYIADSFNGRIRRVDAVSGIITTVAGNGAQTYGGDGGPATNASLQFPQSIALDAQGNLFIADFRNNRIRRVDGATNIISTYAGNGTSGSSGDGGPATSAQIGAIFAIALDAAGNLFLTDLVTVRRVDAATNIISTYAGNGTVGSSGDGGPAASARIQPQAIAVNLGSDLLIGEPNRVRRVDAVTLIISTVAGNGTDNFSGDGSSSIDGSLGLGGNVPSMVALDSSSNLYVADQANNRVRRVDSETGIISTVAGNGTQGYSGDGGAAVGATLNAPAGIAVDPAGNIFIDDNGNNVIRRVDGGTHTISTYAGNGSTGYSGDGGAATNAALSGPIGLAVDASGGLYIADTHNNVIRRVDPSTHIITTFAGTGTAGFSGDGGPAISAFLSQPVALVLDSAGDLYVADQGNGRIRRVDAATGLITTIAGNNLSHVLPGIWDGGPATSAYFPKPSGVAIDQVGNLYVSDATSNRIRLIDAATGIITTLAGNGVPGFAGDTGPSTSALVNQPAGLAVSASGALYFADAGNERVRIIANAPILAFSRRNIDFGTQSVSTTSAAQTVVLTNVGAPLSISNITLTGVNGPDFTQSNDCGAGLATGTSCTITVRFTPSASGSRSAAITITDTAPASPHTISLSGLGLAPVLQSITVSPAAASILLGSATQSFTATGRYSDGSTQDLTATVSWSSSSPSVASIDANGVGHSVGGGTTTITGSLGSVSGTASLTVSQPPIITSANSATFTLGLAGSFTVTASAFPSPTLSESGTLPNGVTFNAATGVLSGTPAGAAAIYNIQFTASNGIGSNAVQNFSLTVNLPSAASLTLNPASVPGGATNSIGTVTLNAPAAGTAAQRAVTLSSGNTAAATVPASVTVAVGATSANFTVTSHAVATTTTANISATLNGGTGSAVLTVTPLPGVASLTLNPASVPGGATNSIGTVTLNAPAVGTAAQRTVTLSSGNTAAATVPASVTVAVGATLASFTVTSHAVGTTTTANISASLNGGAQSAVLTVTPLPGVASLALNPTSVVGGSGNSTATVTLNAPAAGTVAQRTVTLSSGNTAAATVPASVSVAVGATAATFTVTSKIVTTQANAVITATLNGSTIATLTVNPLLVVSLTLNPTSVQGGITNSVGTVTLNAPAAGTVAQRTVTLSSGNTAAATVPAGVTVAAGATTANFTITSHTIATTTTANISASKNGGTQSSTLTVTP